jgi:hypothetical protein
MIQKTLECHVHVNETWENLWGEITLEASLWHDKWRRSSRGF